jgi:DNA-binding SARP family transcriptional activator
VTAGNGHRGSDAVVQKVAILPRSIADRAEPGPIRLSVLGSFGFDCGGRHLRLPGTTQRLLAFLAVHRGPRHRTFVAGMLWPDTTERRASGNLRTTLWRLNAIDAGIIVNRGDCLTLGPSVDVDLDRFERLAQGLLHGETSSRDIRIGRLTLVGELLPGWYDDWVVQERESFRELRLRALERLCSEYATLDRFSDAIEAGLAAIAGDPLRESAHRALIGAYLLEGNRALALRQYRNYRDVLEVELGVTPSHRMASLLDEHGLGVLVSSTGSVPVQSSIHRRD